MGKELTFKTKWAIWNAAIGSILTYSLTTSTQNKCNGRKATSIRIEMSEKYSRQRRKRRGERAIERETKKNKNARKRMKKKGKVEAPEEKEKKSRVQKGHQTPTIISYIEK